MSTEHEEHKSESLIEKITGHHDNKKKDDSSSSSSSSDSDDDSNISAMKSKVFRLFGREKPVHKVGHKKKGFLHEAKAWEGSQAWVLTGEVVSLLSTDLFTRILSNCSLRNV
uniref:Reticulon-like protein B2 n=1 Tax=Tanacetum cinerariifolium TaxID=118510 RepID=A0A6L2P766_TANCI|nr:reticulon-like protein B2 [Tanacetum cinerariifolium]